MQGFFPPSSSVTLFRLLWEAASLTSFPTFGVKTRQKKPRTELKRQDDLSRPWALAACPVTRWNPGSERLPAGVGRSLAGPWLAHGHPRPAAELTSPAAYRQQQPVSPEAPRGGRSARSFGLI